MSKLIKRKLKLKLDGYRKIRRSIKIIDFYKNKVCLVCVFIYFGGPTLRLLKEYFCSKISEIYNYKNNFDFVVTSPRNQNYFYNYKSRKSLNKNILFFLIILMKFFYFYIK